ncbi:MAG: hypothetical protein LBU03_01220 [Tannerellaceae bacterium]|nr:hypothetical protein [Tannerellaceae bacterium]
MNDLVIETNNKSDSYSVYTNPFTQEIFSINCEGTEIHIQLNENTEGERKLTIYINAALSGQGEIRITQRGK